MYNPRMRRFFVVCVVVVNMGCAMSATRLYDGAELPQSQVVVLLDSSEAGVYAVDGTRTFGSAWTLTPGEHEEWLKVRLRTQVPNVNWTIWSYCRHRLVALSGEEYTARVRTRKTVVHGIADKVQIEVAIVDRAGNAVAAPAACDGERPTFD